MKMGIGIPVIYLKDNLYFESFVNFDLSFFLELIKLGVNVENASYGT